MRIVPTTVLLAACATTTTNTPSTLKGGPRGLRASEHLEAAHQQDQAARERESMPDTTMVGILPPGGQPFAMPWYRSWDTAAEHEHLAAIHRSKAAELDAAYEEACGDQPAAEVAVSPLVRYGVGGWETSTSVIIYLSSDAGAPDALLAAMKCHRAWMMLAPADMDSCPLDLPGLVVDARGGAEGITVSLGVNDPALLPELKRRVAAELEASQHHGSGRSLHKGE